MKELKPCPFCGRQVQIEEFVENEPVTFADCGFQVGCDKCKVVFRAHTRQLPGFNEKEDAKAKSRLIARWNRRDVPK